jgi:cobalt-zinc-cadmium efflux system outer membrane protein
VFNVNGGPIARAEAEARAAAVKRDAAAQRIEAQVRAAYESFRAAVTRARFFEAGYVPSATQVEAMAREGFAAGRTGLLPLIEAQRALLDARLGQTEARFAVQSARAELEEASGVTLSAP